MTKEQRTDNIILIVLALCGVLIHILLNGQYGFHRDELDFITNVAAWDPGVMLIPKKIGRHLLDRHSLKNGSSKLV